MERKSIILAKVKQAQMFTIEIPGFGNITMSISRIGVAFTKKVKKTKLRQTISFEDLIEGFKEQIVKNNIVL